MFSIIMFKVKYQQTTLPLITSLTQGQHGHFWVLFHHEFRYNFSQAINPSLRQRH